MVARFRFAKANHSIVGAGAKLRVVNCFADCVWLAVPEATKWQRIGDQIDAAFVFTGTDLASVHFLRDKCRISG